MQRLTPEAAGLAPTAQCDLTIRARLGAYRIHIGAEYSPEECRTRGLARHSRPIRIEGEIDHLYVRETDVVALPDRHDMEHALMGTVVIRGVRVHLFDRQGRGELSPNEQAVEVKEELNLAGPAGATRLETIRRDGRLAREAYGIIQQDILKVLREREGQ
ncbi:MAG: hypothetical protein HY543_04940 [Deltaproteobacteria bacterium]|nr:hypothetical protein [Deltaproteobacteria bacterium]